MTAKELTGRVALVTGASRGLGRAIALKLASQGAKVAVNYAASDEAATTVSKAIRSNGGTAMTVKADVTDGKAVKDMIRRVTGEWGKLDILVNNAGITRDNLLPMINEDAWDEVLNTNLRGAYLCTRFAIRSMTANTWGRIINISSLAGVIGSPGQANYSAAKGGLIAFTKSVARELGPLNITANAIAPGFIVTDMTDQLPEEYRETILARIPLKRFGKPDDVAELVAFLASERAAYITAQVIGIDGGIL
jgi:3-oxoacyl-[acyl-carrier protein] reductase